jgi:hypothetical protein
MSDGHVYVLGFSNGCVKVGRTQNSGQRLKDHKSMAGKFGLTVTDEWLSPPHAEWARNEDALKDIATGLGGTVVGREYYSGIDFAAVVLKALDLPFTASAVPAQEMPKPPRPPRPPVSPPDGLRWPPAEADVLPATFLAAAVTVLSRPEGRYRLAKICTLLDIKASESQEQVIYRYVQDELLALFGDFDRENREIVRIFLELESQSDEARAHLQRAG